MKCLRRLTYTGFLGGLLHLACGSDNGSASRSTPEETGQSCKVAAECFANLDAATVRGAITCMDRVPGGYCTHECQTDADCCAVPGECRTTLPEVCAPFESTGKMYCFLSCEVADIEAHEATLFRDGGAIDPNLFCERRANPSFGCRSTGGGRDNRKVCTP
jgi:hypothetical protein